MKTLALIAVLAGVSTGQSQTANPSAAPPALTANTNQPQKKAVFGASGDVRGDVERFVSRCSDPYKEWSDGKVSCLDTALDRMRGVLPPASGTNHAIGEWIDGFKVLDVAPNGCRITPDASSLGRHDEIFVTGMRDFLSGRIYEHIIFIRAAGPHTYTTAVGVSRTIPKYEYGKAISEAEFTKKVAQQQEKQEKKTELVPPTRLRIVGSGS